MGFKHTCVGFPIGLNTIIEISCTETAHVSHLP